ncbi:MAG: hypothetical protein JRF54_00795 [Deltaproteobacteria bacterium]|nr:hypothetical protein [Deltaproteobacteria bacterium]
MSNEIQIKQLAELFKKTGQAHHQAFIETDGEDPDWPIWYAGYLEDRLTPFLAAPITRSRLVFCLTRRGRNTTRNASSNVWGQRRSRKQTASRSTTSTAAHSAYACAA